MLPERVADLVQLWRDYAQMQVPDVLGQGRREALEACAFELERVLTRESIVERLRRVEALADAARGERAIMVDELDAILALSPEEVGHGSDAFRRAQKMIEAAGPQPARTAGEWTGFGAPGPSERDPLTPEERRQVESVRPMVEIFEKLIHDPRKGLDYVDRLVVLCRIIDKYLPAPVPPPNEPKADPG